jgi:hypothetical protein
MPQGHVGSRRLTVYNLLVDLNINTRNPYVHT